MGAQPRATTPLKELFEQQTGCAVQLVPLTPTPVMGEHVTPTWPVTPLATMPRSANRLVTEGEDADWTELQHCWLLTLHEDAGGAVFGKAQAVAAARIGTSARTLLNNIVFVCEKEIKLVRA